MSRGGGWRPAVTAGSQGRPYVARVSRAGAETGRWPCKFLMAAGTWGSPPIKEADGGGKGLPRPHGGEREGPWKAGKASTPKGHPHMRLPSRGNLDLSLYRGNTAGRRDGTASKLQGTSEGTSY